MVMLAAGDLQLRLTLRRQLEIGDGHDGFDDQALVVFSRIAGSARPLQGIALERARQVDPRISHEVTVRYWSTYRADLAGGRVQWLLHQDDSSLNDRTLEVIGAPIDVEERHVMLQMSCRELV